MKNEFSDTKAAATNLNQWIDFKCLHNNKNLDLSHTFFRQEKCILSFLHLKGRKNKLYVQF